MFTLPIENVGHKTEVTGSNPVVATNFAAFYHLVIQTFCTPCFDRSPVLFLKKQEVAIEFKHYLQKFDYDCGPGVVGLVLKNSGYASINHGKLIKMLETTEIDGTGLVTLTRFFLNLPEFDARPKIFSTWDDLKKELDDNRVSIVAYQNWSEAEDFNELESGHYALVVGVDDKKIRLLDPGIEDGELEFDRQDFESRWIEKDGASGTEIFKNWMLSLRLPDKRGLSFKQKALNAIDKLLNLALGTPPEYEEVLKNFQHDKKCSQNFPLERVEETFPSLGGAGVWENVVSSIPITLKYLECPECHASTHYSG